MTLKKMTACMLSAAVVGFAADEIAAKATRKTTPKSNSAEAMAQKADAVPSARLITYAAKDVVTLKTKLRYTTLIVLPKTEQILDYTCGDKELWVVNGSLNLAYVKPAKEGSQTNLNLITASGNIYTFVLTEVSETPGASPDLKVFVELKDESMTSASTGVPKFVPTETLDACRKQVDASQEDLRHAKQESQSAIENGINRFVANVRFPYQFEAGKKPFLVRAMYHDDKFTYIQARPEETPALYEWKDGKPNLINFEYKNGVYVATKILDRGYLALGKQKLGFTREE